LAAKQHLIFSQHAVTTTTAVALSMQQ